MNELETLRLVDFLETVRNSFGATMPIADSEPIWKAVSYLIRADIHGQTVTISALCDVTDLPYATSRRLVNRLIDEGHITRTARSESGKSYALHPSEDLKMSFENYGRTMKSLLAAVVGKRLPADNDDNYYFGGSKNFDLPKTGGDTDTAADDVRFLLNDDNYALALRNMWSDFRTNLGTTKDFKLLSCHRVRDQLLQNSKLQVSQYDVVAINLPWLGEFAESGYLVPFDSISEADAKDYTLPGTEDVGMWRGRAYGIPIYVTVNLLAARTDLFSAAGLKFPQTLDEVIAAGRELSDPKRNLSGLIWDAAPGMPIAHSFMFFMAAFDSPIISLRKTFRGFSLDDMDLDTLVPLVDSEAGHETLDYMHRLLEISPPNVLNLAWDDSLRFFLRGNAAMSYCWSMRAARFEYDVRSTVKRRVTYLPHPAKIRRRGTVPVGGFLLAVPSNLPSERIDKALEAIKKVTRGHGRSRSHESRSPILPNFVLSADPEIRASAPIANAVEKWASQGLLQSWCRSPIPQFREVETVLGEEIHLALSGAKSDRAALRDATQRILRFLSRNELRRSSA